VDALCLSTVRSDECQHSGNSDARPRPTTQREKDAELAQKLGQPQPFIAYSQRNAWANLNRLGQP
jgi:hypothetical protein